MIELFEDLIRMLHELSVDAHIAMGDDVLLAVALVDEGLKNLNSLPRDLCPTQAADELFALAAEHAARDHFDAAGMGTKNVHVSKHAPYFYRPPHYRTARAHAASSVRTLPCDSPSLA